MVRLAREDADPADWLAFTAWLDAAPPDRPELHREAFDRAQRLWLQADGLAATSAPLRQPRRTRAYPVSRVAGWGLAAAAGMAAVVIGLWLRAPPPFVAPPSPVGAVYTTAAGQRRSLVLPDGSRVEMNGATTLAVGAMGRTARSLTLVRGEADFDVVHEPARPFTVALGAVRVRVLGTAFDVLRDQDVTQVSVARGLVAMDTPHRSVRLPAGRSATLLGATMRISPLAPAQVGLWRTGRRTYWEEPLQVVVADLNRSYPGRIELADATARRLRFTGTLAPGSREETVRRLTTLLRLQAVDAPGGAILLRSPHA